MMDLLEKVRNSEKTKAVWREDYRSEEFTNASKLNVILFGAPLNHRPKCSCIEDMFYMLKSKSINEKYKNKMEQVFKVKKGKVISSFKFNFHLTEHSTDELIIQALKVDQKLIDSLEFYPENWKVICGLEKKPRKTRAKKL